MSRQHQSTAELGRKQIGHNEFSFAAKESQMRISQTRSMGHLDNCPRARLEFNQETIGVVAGNQAAAAFRYKSHKIT